MIEKHPIYPHRVRKPPRQFSWLDQRLVRDRYLERCSHQAAALYLFLVSVADGQGLSYYSDPSVMKRLSMDARVLSEARENLIGVQLIAYEKPLYQVLPLDSEGQLLPSQTRTPMDQPMSFGQILKKIAGGLS
jgi:hypothetical protein